MKAYKLLGQDQDGNLYSLGLMNNTTWELRKGLIIKSIPFNLYVAGKKATANQKLYRLGYGLTAFLTAQEAIGYAKTLGLSPEPVNGQSKVVIVECETSTPMKPERMGKRVTVAKGISTTKDLITTLDENPADLNLKPWPKDTVMIRTLTPKNVIVGLTGSYKI